MRDEEREGYDSSNDTWAHILKVRSLMEPVIFELQQRAEHHDYSKLGPPEKAAFDAVTPRLKSSTYGSEEYRATLREIRPALDHHYLNNRHHPEHFPRGTLDMTLVDMIEMLVDWKAASTRHANGDLKTSILHNQVRFGYSEDVKQLLLNTAEKMGWL